jgi:hypothetical protein
MKKKLRRRRIKMEERRKHYNPADYAEVQREAKAMDKSALEEYYVRERDSNYTRPCMKVVGFVVVVGLIFLVGLAIVVVANSMTSYELEKSRFQLEQEICPILNNFQFTLQEEKWTGREDVTIKCRS